MPAFVEQKGCSVACLLDSAFVGGNSLRWSSIATSATWGVVMRSHAASLCLATAAWFRPSHRRETVAHRDVQHSATQLAASSRPGPMPVPPPV